MLLSLNGCAVISTPNEQTNKNAVLIHAQRVFDGYTFRTNTSVLIVDDQIAQIGSPESIKIEATKTIDLGDATLLPGFIELHAHLNFQNVPAEIVLKHGITTLRDVGGPIRPPQGGKGNLRILTAGPIITAPNGYPITIFGNTHSAIAVSTAAEARQTVSDLAKAGAVIIKIALEPGGESGAPWSSDHGHVHPNNTAPEWPLLPENIVKAIVDEAHQLNRKVTAHIGEEKGAEIAINAGVDEWTHIPCAVIPKNLLKKAVEQQVKIITTLDTLSKCSGIAHNTKILSSLGAELLYGAEIAHPDIPWGIDIQELNYLMRYANLSTTEVLKTATSKAGQHLNIPLLGVLQSGAPADMIAIKGHVLNSLKSLEYPDLVISGGKIIVNNF